MLGGCLSGGRQVNWLRESEVTLHSSVPIMTTTSDSVQARSSSRPWKTKRIKHEDQHSPFITVVKKDVLKQTKHDHTYVDGEVVALVVLDAFFKFLKHRIGEEDETGVESGRKILHAGNVVHDESVLHVLSLCDGLLRIYGRRSAVHHFPRLDVTALKRQGQRRSVEIFTLLNILNKSTNHERQNLNKTRNYSHE